MGRLLPLALSVLVVAAFVGGQSVRQHTGLEVSLESVQAWLVSLGWWAPALYLGLVTFRIFFFLPSWVVLTAGGVIFGALVGTALGGLGIALSALIVYALARGIGRDRLRSWMLARHAAYQSIERAGPVLVGVVTAHPVAPMSALHAAAGLSTLPIVGFVAAVTVGGVVRAFLLSFFGASLIEPDSWAFVIATALLLGVVLLPLVHPRVRRKLFPRSAAAEESRP